METRITFVAALQNQDLEERHILLKNILEERHELLSKPSHELKSDDTIRLAELDINKLYTFKKWEFSKTPLMQATSDNDVKSINLLLAAKADTQIHNDIKNTALFSAIRDGYIDSVKALLNDNNIHQSVDGKTPLLFASLYGKEEIAGLLLDSKANVNVLDNEHISPLMYAVVQGKTNLVKKMLECKVDITVRRPNGVTVIGCAAAQSDVEMVKALVSAGVDLSSYTDKSLFIIAAQSDQKEIFDLLVNLYREKNISPNAYINKVDGDGYSALTSAIEKNNAALTKTILDMKADFNANGGLGTPAMFAASKCGDDPTILKLLIERKADLSKKVGKITALDCAIETGHSEIYMIIQQWKKYHSRSYRLFHKTIPEINYEQIHRDACKELIKDIGVKLDESSEAEVLEKIVKM